MQRFKNRHIKSKRKLCSLSYEIFANIRLICAVLEKYCISVSAHPPDSTALIPFLQMRQTSINSIIRFLVKNFNFAIL